MRVNDRMECAALGLTPIEYIKLSMERSHSNWTWLVDREPAAIGGIEITSMLGGAAVAWIFTTDIVDEHKLAFTRMTMRMKKAVTAIAPNFRGHIHARHREALRWAQWMGLEISPEFLIGPKAEPHCEVRAVEA
jgi:hypothetical protein